LAVFANLREAPPSPDGPDAPELSLDPATSKRPVLTSTPFLPMRYLVGGLVGLILFCVLGYVVARNLGGDAGSSEKRIAGRGETPDPPPVKPITANPDDSGVVAVPDLTPAKKKEEPYV